MIYANALYSLGAEFAVIKRMIVSGIIRHVDVLAVEWHHGEYFVTNGDQYTAKKVCLADWLLSDNTGLRLEEWH